MAAQCFMHVFTDLGWRVMDEAGKTDGPHMPGFVWHTDPGCILLPGAARICFLRCDNATCMLDEVQGSSHIILPGPWVLIPIVRLPCIPHSNRALLHEIFA